MNKFSKTLKYPLLYLYKTQVENSKNLDYIYILIIAKNKYHF